MSRPTGSAHAATRAGATPDPAGPPGRSARPGRVSEIRGTAAGCQTFSVGVPASSEGAEPGSGRPADSAMRHTANPPITAAAIM